jgi:hypothetical protein
VDVSKRDGITNTHPGSNSEIGLRSEHSDTFLSHSLEKIKEAYGRLPLSFEANRGQSTRQVKFLSRGPGYNLFLTERAAVLSLNKAKSTESGPQKLSLDHEKLLSELDSLTDFWN